MRPYSLAAILLVAGCQPGAPTSPPDGEASPVAPEPAPAPSADRIASSGRLAGEYRVAGVDGQGIDLPYGIGASISADRILVSSDCVRLEWAYRFAGADLVTERTPTAGCERGFNEVEQAIADAFDAATQVAINRSNGYEFTGGGRTVTLFTQ